jgi:hypothetical protein
MKSLKLCGAWISTPAHFPVKLHQAVLDIDDINLTQSAPSQPHQLEELRLKGPIGHFSQIFKVGHFPTSLEKQFTTRPLH